MEIEPDQSPGAAHPRLSFQFIGHEAEEAALAEALSGPRLHHAWLICGPQRLGKASLAYRAARVALGARCTGPRPLDVDADDPIARRVGALTHPDFFVLRRGLNERGRTRREITADEARALSAFFALAPSEGGRRVAIVDAVDDLNRFAANALLKTLEEPPPGALLMLICHAPGAILPTIRSRCRKLTLRPLPDAEIARALPGEATQAALAAAKGRPGFAASLDAEALAFIEATTRALQDLSAKGSAALLAATLRQSGDRASLLFELARDEAYARAIAGGPDAQAWAETWAQLGALEQEADGLDMDGAHAAARAASLLDRTARQGP